MCWSYLDLFGPAHGKLAWIKSCIFDSLQNGLCNYTMGCSPVRGDNPRALASGLPYVQVDKHCIIFFIIPHVNFPYKTSIDERLIFYIIIPHVNFPYKTSIDERLIFYNITRCYSDGEYCHSCAIAAGDIIKYQSFI